MPCAGLVTDAGVNGPVPSAVGMTTVTGVSRAVEAEAGRATGLTVRESVAGVATEPAESCPVKGTGMCPLRVVAAVTRTVRTGKLEPDATAVAGLLVQAAVGPLTVQIQPLPLGVDAKDSPEGSVVDRVTGDPSGPPALPTLRVAVTVPVPPEVVAPASAAVMLSAGAEVTVMVTVAAGDTCPKASVAV